MRRTHRLGYWIAPEKSERVLDSSFSHLKNSRRSNFLRFSDPGGGDRKVKDREKSKPFAKVVEWLDLQVNMEGTLLFRSYDSEFPALFPLLPSPRKRESRGGRTGKQRENSGKTQSTGTSRIWVPAFAGMTKSGIAFRPEYENRSKRSTRLCRRLPHTFVKRFRVQTFDGKVLGTRGRTDTLLFLSPK